MKHTQNTPQNGEINHKNNTKWSQYKDKIKEYIHKILSQSEHKKNICDEIDFIRKKLTEIKRIKNIGKCTQPETVEETVEELLGFMKELKIKINNINTQVKTKITELKGIRTEWKDMQTEITELTELKEIHFEIECLISEIRRYELDSEKKILEGHCSKKVCKIGIKK